MTSYAEARRLPRGWAHLALQIAVWFGFYAAYQVARGAADRGIAEAFWNGTLVIEAENRYTRWSSRRSRSSSQRSEAPDPRHLVHVLALAVRRRRPALLWVYFRHHDRFADFRNWLIGANLLGLIGYVLMPTAPPRMYPEWGFTDTLAEYASVNHDSGLISFAANPYAAMPSLHAMDALIVGIVMASVCRSRIARAFWLLWPAWVSFAVMGTGNHYWLDCVAGFAVALLTAALLFRRRLPRVLTARRDRAGRRRAGRSCWCRASARHHRQFPSSTGSSRSTPPPRGRSSSAPCAASPRRS